MEGQTEVKLMEGQTNGRSTEWKVKRQGQTSEGQISGLPQIHTHHSHAHPSLSVHHLQKSAKYFVYISNIHNNNHIK